MAEERRYLGPRGTNPNATVPYEDAHKIRTRVEDTSADYLVNKIAGSLVIDTETNKLRLSGDEIAPGANKVYGTDESGNKTWRDAPAGSGGGVSTVPVEYVVTATGGETSVDCTSVWPTAETFFVAVFRNGQRLVNINDYTVLTASKNITFAFALVAGDVIQVLFNEVDGGVVVNNQVAGASTKTHVFTATGGETSVDCSDVWPLSDNYLFEVFVNGMRQTPTEDYSLNENSSAVDFTYALESGDLVLIVVTQYIVSVVVTSHASHKYVATASQTQFDISSLLPKSAFMLIVSKNGVVQAETEDYTVANGVLTFVDACSEGSIVYVQCLGVDGSFHESLGFVDLADTPTSYTNQAGKMLVVKEDETGLELIDRPQSGGVSMGMLLALM